MSTTCMAERALDAARWAFAAGGDDEGDEGAIWSCIGTWRRNTADGVTLVDFEDGSLLLCSDDAPWEALCPDAFEEPPEPLRSRLLTDAWRILGLVAEQMKREGKP